MDDCYHSGHDPECGSCWKGAAQRCQAENNELRVLIAEYGDEGLKRLLAMYNEQKRGGTIEKSHALISSLQRHELLLDNYERENLLLLLNICGFPFDGHGLEPFTIMNNGDWLGQIVMKLCGGFTGNISFEEMLADEKICNTYVNHVRQKVQNWKDMM